MTKATKFSHGDWTACACYVAGGNAIVSSGEDGVIRSWARTGALMHELRDPSYASCCGAPTGSLVALFNGGPADITLWDAATGTVVRTLAGHPKADPRHEAGGNVTCAVFGPGGALLASGGFDHRVRLWSVRTGAALTNTDVGGLVSSIAFSYDGSLVAAGVFPKRVVVIASATGKKVAEATASKKAVTSVAFTASGEIVTGGGAGELVRWRLDGRKLVRLHAYRKPDGGGIEGLAISPDGKLLAAASRARWMRVWELDSGSERGSLAREGELGLDVDFSPNGRQLMMAGPSPIVFVALAR